MRGVLQMVRRKSVTNTLSLTGEGAFIMTTTEIKSSILISNQGRVRDLQLTSAQVNELIASGYCVATAGRDGCTVYAPSWRGESRQFVMPSKSIEHDYEGAILARQYLPS
jgi:hypothetical protein